MGNQQPKKAPPRKSMQDHIIDMKMNAKQLQRAAKTSEKQAEKLKKQAKDALKKNQEDFAGLYISSSAQKSRQALNYQRTAVKMQLMCDKIKSMKNNEKMMNTFGNLSHVITQQMGNVDTMRMAENMQNLNNKMDEIMINNKMMEEVMKSDQVVDNTADDMLAALKQEISLEEQQKLIGPGQMNTQTNQQKNQMQQGYDPFLDQLKGL